MENKKNNSQQNQSSDKLSDKQCQHYQYEKDKLDVDCKHGVGCNGQQPTPPTPPNEGANTSFWDSTTGVWIEKGSIVGASAATIWSALNSNKSTNNNNKDNNDK